MSAVQCGIWGACEQVVSAVRCGIWGTTTTTTVTVTAMAMIMNSEKKSRAFILTHCIHISRSAPLDLLSFLRGSCFRSFMDGGRGEQKRPLAVLVIACCNITHIHTYTFPYVRTLATLI